MPWVKRNLGLVIGGAVALVLMALAGFYLWTKIQSDAEVTAQLDEQTQQFQTLLSRPVHPGTDEKTNNIKLAQDEKARLQQFLTQVRANFGTRDVPTNISDREFRALLDPTIAELQRQANEMGITLPDKDYWFTFAPQKQAVAFKNTQMLTYQLLDIKDICSILYSSKIHDLKRIKRVAASSEDNNPTDFIDKKASTNDFAIVTPYEVTFQGFSTELASVLEGLVSAKHCFVVRSIVALKAPEDSGAQNNMMQMPVMNNPMSRYFQRGPVAPVAPPPQARRPGSVLLDESKLQFTIVLDSVRLKPLSETQPAAQPAADPAVAQY